MNIKAFLFFTIFFTISVSADSIFNEGKVTVEKINYKGWANCYRISNGTVDLIVTTDVGPRIIRFGFVGEENEFAEFENEVGKTGGNEWHPYGGHRLWHAPEAVPRTYYPDNVPIKIEQLNGVVRLIQPVESTTGIQKEIDITLSTNTTRVQIIHRLRNTNLWAVELAPWALSVMAPGGKAVFPLPPRGSHPKDLLPTSFIVLWAYTDFTDTRWSFGKKYVFLTQASTAKDPQKAGFIVSDEWGAYVRNGHCFLKKVKFFKDTKYPDFGCNFETFTNKDMLELETLGPIALIEPNATVEHIENWYLYKNVPMPKTDADVDRDILPKVK
jgi:hypothetical protein